jgi:hypothetical protein
MSRAGLPSTNPGGKISAFTKMSDDDHHPAGGVRQLEIIGSRSDRVSRVRQHGRGAYGPERPRRRRHAAGSAGHRRDAVADEIKCQGVPHSHALAEVAGKAGGPASASASSKQSAAPRRIARPCAAPPGTPRRPRPLPSARSSADRGSRCHSATHYRVPHPLIGRSALRSSPVRHIVLRITHAEIRMIHGATKSPDRNSRRARSAGHRVLLHGPLELLKPRTALKAAPGDA